MLFSKAICKLNMYKWKDEENFDFDKLVGDGSIMYSLTGLIPETLDICSMNDSDREKL